MHSAIYKGTILHRRRVPVEHKFKYRLFMMYLDLEELPDVFSGSRWFSVSRRALARFCREDHFGDRNLPLDQAVRDLVEQQSGRRPVGPVRLLTHLRYFGYVFNPVSFYYCFNKDDTEVEAMVAEVNNTPWGERHCYVLTREQECGYGKLKRYRPRKQMHVSPFMPMDIEYDWRFTPPDDVLSVYMANSRKGTKLFDAALSLRRHEISPRALLNVLCAFPLMTVTVIAAIYWQALLLWLKRCPVFAHPKHGKRKQRATQIAAVKGSNQDLVLEDHQ